MKLNSFDKVKQLTEEMVAIPSINKEPGGESAVARYIQDFYMSLPYFQAHPEQVKCFQTKNDFVVRHSTLAYVKGTKGNSNRTVILIGHIDTVGVDDFGTIREYAFRCEELPAKLRETFVLPQEVIDDIESGEYLFGRGALDMKSGVAGHMYLIQYFSEHPEELDGNLLAIGECDEEDNSKGIITALAVLASGVWTQEGLSSGQLALAAFQSVFGSFGAIFVAITVFLFVFSTIISAGFFGQIQAEILFGRKFSKIWVFMYPLFIGIACAFSNVTTMYMITDGFMAIIVILNMIGLLLMCKQVKDLQKEYYNTPGMYYLADKAAKEAKKAAK